MFEKEGSDRGERDIFQAAGLGLLRAVLLARPNGAVSTSRRQHDRARRVSKADRRAVALKEYGSEDAVWEPCEWEAALERACRPVIVRKPIIGGEMDTLQGWDGGYFDRMPAEVRAAVASAYPLPAAVREAWAELQFWEKLYDDRDAFGDHDHRVWVRARTAHVEHLLDTLPAKSVKDLLARIDWMEHINNRGFSRDVREDAVLLATLRADVERMGQRIREQAVHTVNTPGAPRDGSGLSHAEDHTNWHTPSRSPDPKSPSAGVQNGQGEVSNTHPAAERNSAPRNSNDLQQGSASGAYPLRRTNADKRRDVLALLNARHEGIPLSDREIARRVGVSPTTVGTIRRSHA